MDDNALAPVIAVMLILAIGVTVFAVYTTTYLPGLKQQAEVGHIKEVETGFLKFSSDIDNAIAAGKNMINAGISNQPVEYSETIPLGGGDIIVNSMKSGGIVRIQRNESPVFKITINDNLYSNSSYLVNFSYNSTNNFWNDQGYTWERGNVIVNQLKGQREALISRNDKFPGSLVTYQHTGNEIHINFVNFSIEKSSISGNGNAILKLNSTVYNLTPDPPIVSKIELISTNDELNNKIQEWGDFMWDGNKWINNSYGDQPPHIILNKIEVRMNVQ
jgi:hypothetical protein